MATEYGVQSWCSYDELETVTKGEDRSWSSNWVKHRQHHTLDAIKRDAEVTNSVIFGQTDLLWDIRLVVNQAMSIRAETEHYRRGQSNVIKGLGGTMGALYWQLNDIWQAPSWSSIEYSGRWKMLHYFARKFFAPNLISPYLENDTLKVYIIMESFGSKSEFKHSDFKLRKGKEISKRTYRYYHQHNSITNNENTTLLYPNLLTKMTDNLRYKNIHNLPYEYKLKNLRYKNGHNQNIQYENSFNNLQHTNTHLVKENYQNLESNIVKIDDRDHYIYNSRHGKMNFENARYGNIHTESGNVETENESGRDGKSELVIEMYSWKSRTPLYSWKQPFVMKKISQLVFTSSISSLMKASKCPTKDECFLHFSVTSGGTFEKIWLPLTSFLKCKKYIPKARVKITGVTKTKSTFTISLHSDNIAAFVWLSSHSIQGRFSDNGFLMLTSTMTLTFEPWQTTTVAKLKSALTVMSLMDLYL